MGDHLPNEDGFRTTAVFLTNVMLGMFLARMAIQADLYDSTWAHALMGGIWVGCTIMGFSAKTDPYGVAQDEDELNWLYSLIAVTVLCVSFYLVTFHESIFLALFAWWLGYRSEKMLALWVGFSTLVMGHELGRLFAWLMLSAPVAAAMLIALIKFCFVIVGMTTYAEYCSGDQLDRWHALRWLPDILYFSVGFYIFTENPIAYAFPLDWFFGAMIVWYRSRSQRQEAS